MIKRHALIMSLLITFLIGANTLLFSFISSQRENLIIKRVIDGDTLVFNNNKTARLLNINTPEKKSPLSQKSFNFLKDYENKSVEVEFKSRDKYGRDLVKIYTPKYLNLEIVQQGYANKFLVSEEELEIFKKAEENAINNSKGIWNVSSYFNCFFASVFPEEELIELENNCKNINLKDWILKDESRKEYKFENVSINNKLSIKTKRGNTTKEKV
ncbi:MAG: thermonuclease family protein, partial [Nanoarchaeota archaeon]